MGLGSDSYDSSELSPAPTRRRRVAPLLAASILALAGHSRAVVFTVTNTDPGGPGSLAQAVADANASAGPDDVVFAIPGAGPHVIATTGLQLSDPVRIDGYSQPGAQPNSLAEGSDALLQIVLDGEDLLLAGVGIRLLAGAEGSVIRGLSIIRHGSGSTGGGIASSVDATVEGCWIGIGPDGLPAGNGGTGIAVTGTSVVGGADPAARNVVGASGGAGIQVGGGDGARVQGNYVGTGPQGLADFGNAGAGISILGGSDVLVGGSAPGEGNLVSGNDGNGITLQGPSDGTVFEGNRVGTTRVLEYPLPNAGHGLFAFDPGAIRVGPLQGGAGTGGQKGFSGNGFDEVGDLPAGSNVFAFNGITGTSMACPSSAGVAALIVARNGMLRNGGPGIESTDCLVEATDNVLDANFGAGISALGSAGSIDLSRGRIANAPDPALDNGGASGPDGRDANDPGDLDTGPNGKQNGLEITSLQIDHATRTAILGATFSGASGSPYAFELFSNRGNAPGQSGLETFLATLTFLTNAQGLASFTATVTGPPLARDSEVCAIVRDSGGNTSEESCARDGDPVGPQLRVTKEASTDFIDLGQVAEFTVTITNFGDADAQDVEVQDIPLADTFFGLSSQQLVLQALGLADPVPTDPNDPGPGSGWTFDGPWTSCSRGDFDPVGYRTDPFGQATEPLFVCRIDTLPAGASASFSVPMRPTHFIGTANPPGGAGRYRNRVRALLGGVPVAEDRDDILVTAGADLSTQLSAPSAPVDPQEEFTVGVSVSNQGPEPAGQLQVEVDLAGGAFQFLGAFPGTWFCLPGLVSDVVCQNPVEVDAGQDSSFDFRLRAEQPGSHLVMAVASDAATPDFTPGDNVDAALVTVTGASPPDIDVAGFDFGDVLVGSIRSQLVRVSNLGQGDLTVTGIALDQGGQGFFLADVPGLPAVVPPTGFIEFRVVLSPSAPGSAVDSVTITSDDPDEPDLSPLFIANAVVLEPDIDVQAPVTDFGTLPPGSQRSETIRVQNLGFAALNVSDISLQTGGQGFFLADRPDLPTTVPVGGSFEFTVVFLPDGPDSAVDAVRITSDDPDEGQQLVTVVGEGARGFLDPSPAALDFGEVKQGDAGDLSLTLANPGAGSVSILGLDVSDPQQFNVALVPLPRQLDAGDRLVVQVGFEPTSQGPVQGLLVVTSDDAGAPVLSLPLTGLGLGTLGDRDGDGVPDGIDNCVDVPNPDQADRDAGQDDDASVPGDQSYGDACDQDVDGDGRIGAGDFFASDGFRPCLFASLLLFPGCIVFDVDGDGVVGPADFFAALGFRNQIGSRPGPGVDPPNRPPVAVDDVLVSEAAGLLTIDVLANDSDPDGDPIRVIDFDLPVAANSILLRDDGTLQLDVPTGFAGRLDVKYTIEDDRGGQDEGIATITVRPPGSPTAVDDQAATRPGTNVLVDVLANDSDPGGLPLQLRSARRIGTWPDDASLSYGVPGSQIFVQPGSSFTGVLELEYTVENQNGLPATARLRVVVDASGDAAPVLDLPDDLVIEAPGPGGPVGFGASALDDLDGSLPVFCSPASGSFFPLGTTRVFCNATDSGGKVSSGSFLVTLVDTTPPELHLEGDITAEATGPGGAAVDFSTLAYDRVDGQVPVSCSLPPGFTFPLGTTVVDCTAVDAAGNLAQASFTVTIVTPGTPRILSTPRTRATVGFEHFDLVVAVDPDPGDSISFSLDEAPTGMSISSVGQIRWTPDDQQLGEHDVTVRVTDLSGSFSRQSFTIEGVAPTPPIADAGPDQTVRLGSTVTLDGSGSSDPDGGPQPLDFQWDFDSVPATSALTSDDFDDFSSATPSFVLDSTGDYVVRLTVGDGLNQDSDTVVVTALPASNRSPQIVSTPPPTATEDQLYTYDVDATDPDVGDVLTFSLDLAPAGVSIDAASGVIQWTPGSSQVGSQTMVARVGDDHGGFATQSFVVSVESANLRPDADAGPDQTVPLGTSVDLDAGASSDPDGGPLGLAFTWALVSTPAGSSLTTLDIASLNASMAQLTPDVVGTYVLRVSVDDGRDSDDDTVTITVVPASNRSPRIVSLPPRFGTVGLLYTYDVEATDDDPSDVLVFSLDVGPAGMSIGTATGLAQWTPSPAQLGFNRVVVRVRDEAGAASTQQFDVNVLPGG